VAKRGSQHEKANLDFIQHSDITQVAQAIGLQLDTKKTTPRRAICPFHNDTDPSLNLYHSGSSMRGRDHYHCFVCGAHGDALSLIQNYENLSFWDAAKRLANLQGFELPQAGRATVDKRSGLDAFSEQIDAANLDDAELALFAKERGFSPKFIKDSGGGIVELKQLIGQALGNRSAEEKFVAAGLLRRKIVPDDQPDFYGPPLQGFFTGKRLVFKAADTQQGIAGFIARSLKGDKYKYLYSYGFPRRSTLFGLDRVLSKLQKGLKGSDKKQLEVFLVEGIFDVLRLESLGFSAVAILGSRLSSGNNSQLEKLKLLAETAYQSKVELKYRIFLDHDTAGKSGSYDAVVELMKLLGSSTKARDSISPFDLDVICVPVNVDDKSDPDALLKNVSQSEAYNFIEAASVSALRYLAAYRLGIDPHQPDLGKPSKMKLAAEARQVALALGEISFSRAFGPLEFEASDELLSGFYEAILSYSSNDQAIAPHAQKQESYFETLDDRAALLTALSFGRASTLKREYPLEDDAWERLAVAASPLFHLHCKRLEIADSPSAPLLTRHVPKGGGRYRMKSGPVAEDAVLQQYVLLELLRDRSNENQFSKLVPAIRYQSGEALDGGIYRTGSTKKRRALSFAYQIDMDVINGTTPPGRTGIFRHFFDCWRSFIDYIDDQIRQFDSDNLQILRLDITGFYDHIRRHAVSDALVNPLNDALNVLPETTDGRHKFAPLLDPCGGALPANRARIVTDFLLNHSFGCSFSDPETGKVESTDPMIGIPQGPDLSAYLANISLFGLDDMMEDEIKKLNKDHDNLFSGARTGPIRASYARYVDDLVLVCPDIETAIYLRRKIETFLKNVGLALNRKNTTPPPMSRAEARSWLTDNRAGFGFSGPFSELPTTDAMDPLADAGEIDRKSALGLLYDPELDDPENGRRGLNKIRLALSAPDIRFGDRANAFKRLWCIAASEQEEPSGEGLTKAFLALLEVVEPFSSDFEQGYVPLDLGLACLDGLEKALRLSIPKGELSGIRVEKFRKIQHRLSECVLDDAFRPLAKAIFQDEDPENLLLRYDVRSQIGIIAVLAVEKIRSITSIGRLSKLKHYFVPTGSITRPKLAHGVWLSLFKIDPSSIGPPSTLVVSGQATAEAAFAKVNYEIVKLQRIEAHGPTEDDTAPHNTVSQVTGSTVDLASLTNQILRVWNRSNQAEDDNDDEAIAREAYPIELDAAATFINITYRHFGNVVTGRKRLLQLIANSSSAQPLPSPPGLETSGILLWSEDKLLLATTETTNHNVLGVSWLEHDAPQVAGIKLNRADLPLGSKPIYLGGLDWTPSVISEVYRSFLPLFLDQRPEDSSAELWPVPTAFSFFGKFDGQSLDPASAKLICWAAPKESVDGLAFVRNGFSLEARKVFSVNADFWRYGWAIRDLCNRPDLPTDDEDGQYSHASTPLTNKTHRREAILARVLPRLSGADKWGAGKLTNGLPVPTRIDRALRLLDSFGKSQTQEDDASYLISALTEGTFMSDRINNDPDLSIPGKTAGQIVSSVRRLSKGLPEAAKLWRPIEKTTPSYHRRSARAWALLGENVKRHANDEIARQPLKTLALGLDITAALFDLRALAFELSSQLTFDDLTLLGQSTFELSWVEDLAGPDILLFDRGNSNPNSELEYQLALLLSSFTQVILTQGLNSNSVRDMVTPAGWVIILAIILQVIPVRAAPIDPKAVNRRPKLWRMSPDKAMKAEEVLRPLLIFLSATGETDKGGDDWPWSAFEKLEESKPKNLVQLIGALTELTSIQVDDEISHVNPRTGENPAGRSIIRLADGTSQALSNWQIDIAHILGERGTRTETNEDPDDRMTFNYSTSRIGAKVVGVHLVSHQLSEVTLQNIVPSLDAKTQDRGVSTVLGKTEDPELLPTVQSGQLAQADTIDTSGRAAEDQLFSTKSGSLQKLFQKQLRAWKNRSKDRSPSLRRFAIVQWDVAETYFRPTYKNGKYEGLLVDGEAATSTSLSAKVLAVSTTEFRRRQILEQVLEACLAFEVEGIVLPEYSVRPETVNWLSRKIEKHKMPIIVWCGTFRVPSGSKLDQFEVSANSSVPFSLASVEPTPTGRLRWHYHAALMTCLRGIESASPPKFQVQHYVRQKRYPAAAAGELIRPPISEEWAPMLRHVKDPFDLGTYALELICAEMFPHASSSNLVGILEETAQLLKKYNPEVAKINILEALNDDIHNFAKWTTYRSSAKLKGIEHQPLARGKQLQRTLIVLPAMTTRTADYHIFGQNQYLAAGLVTAFCNAVTPKLGIGESAFIGLNGWTTTEGVETPYGTLAPGIFELGNSEHSGPLGKNEAAIVIADLDLIRTADQKPRPHYQSRPLRIVAHLPMIFATEAGKGVGKFDYPNGNRKERKRPLGVQNELKKFEDFVSTIEDAIEADGRSRPFFHRSKSETDLEHLANEGKILTALEVLEAFVDDPKWMKKRTQSYKKERFDYPPELPLPALMDWLYIDDRWQKAMEDNSKFDEFTDPMATDLPLLAIGAIPRDELARDAD
jgi:DNA primase catalytic core